MSQIPENKVNSCRIEIISVLRSSTALMWLIVGFWSWCWLGPTWAAAMKPNQNQIIDFYQDWGSAHNYWSGLPIYSPHSISIPRYLGLPSNPEPSIEYNIHPPTSVLLVLPLGRLDYSRAVLVWNVISLVALLGSLVIVAMVLPVPRALFLPGLALVPFCLPVLGNLQMGQINMVLCLLLTTMWALERSGRANIAGSVLGLATAIKLFPAYLSIYYAAQQRNRPLGIALLSFLSLTLITALILGEDAYHDYITIVLPWNAEFRIFGYNISIAGLWHKLFYPLNPGEKIIPIWQSLALARWGTLLSNLAITLIIVAFTRRAQTRAQCDLAFAITMTAMLLVSPVTWDISLLLLLVPVSVIGCHTANLQGGWISIALVLILPIVWLPQPLLTTLVTAGRTIDVAPPSFLLGAASLKFYALVAIFILGLVALRADKVNARDQPDIGATGG
jgi:hypothetical protein